MDNLNLEPFTDSSYNSSVERKVDVILDRVIWRTYSPTGRGGIFPLEHPRGDQRLIEITYQLSAYLIEQEE